MIDILQLTDIETWGGHGKAAVGDCVHLGGVDAGQRWEGYNGLPNESIGEAQVVVFESEEKETSSHPIVGFAHFTVGERTVLVSATVTGDYKSLYPRFGQTVIYDVVFMMFLYVQL